MAAWTFKQRPYAYIIGKHLIKRARPSRNKAEIIIKYRNHDRLQVIEASKFVTSSMSFLKEPVYILFRDLSNPFIREKFNSAQSSFLIYSNDFRVHHKILSNSMKLVINLLNLHFRPFCHHHHRSIAMIDVMQYIVPLGTRTKIHVILPCTGARSLFMPMTLCRAKK